MPGRQHDQITAILVEAGDREGAADKLGELVPAVYRELRAMAARRLRSERSDFTLSPTELVHEAYVKLADTNRVTALGRAYFFACAARAMRSIVVDHARRRRRLKRGGGERAVTLDEAAALIDGVDIEILDLDRGLDQLTVVASRAARVVECRFYGGLTVGDTALALGVTTRTVNRDWEFARAWLFDFLKAEQDAT